MLLCPQYKFGGPKRIGSSGVVWALASFGFSLAWWPPHRGCGTTLAMSQIHWWDLTVLLLAHLTVHMDPECLLITRRTYPLRLCYCVTKLHRCFHYDVDSDFVLHSNCRCSENVDVATDKFWPVVTMCRRCSPFPERQDDGNSSAH